MKNSIKFAAFGLLYGFMSVLPVIMNQLPNTPLANPVLIYPLAMAGIPLVLYRVFFYLACNPLAFVLEQNGRPFMAILTSLILWPFLFMLAAKYWREISSYSSTKIRVLLLLYIGICAILSLSALVLNG